MYEMHSKNRILSGEQSLPHYFSDYQEYQDYLDIFSGGDWTSVETITISDEERQMEIDRAFANHFSEYDTEFDNEFDFFAEKDRESRRSTFKGKRYEKRRIEKVTTILNRKFSKGDEFSDSSFTRAKVVIDSSDDGYSVLEQPKKKYIDLGEKCATWDKRLERISPKSMNDSTESFDCDENTESHVSLPKQGTPHDPHVYDTIDKGSEKNIQKYVNRMNEKSDNKKNHFKNSSKKGITPVASGSEPNVMPSGYFMKGYIGV